MIKETVKKINVPFLSSFLYSLYGLLKYRRLCWVLFDDVWIHRYLDGIMVNPKLYLKRSMSSMVSEAIDYYFNQYMPKAGDIVIDVGAGIGIETLVSSQKVGPTGLVLAVEAHPRTFLCLKKLCKYNKLNNVIPINCAITDQEDSKVIIENNDMYISNSIMTNNKGIKVPCTTLDQLIRRHKISKVDFLKMNIEGAEKIAIIGMKESIGLVKNVLIACHDFKAERDGLEFMRTRNNVSSFLKSYGFTLDRRENDPRPWIRDHVYGRRSG